MDFAEQVKSSVDIVKVVGEYVRLKKAGAGPRYSGLCPFHGEKTPSFSVHTTHQFYKCFGCGASGDVFKFVMEMERIGFFEALKLVAERNGIPMPKRDYADPESKVRGALLDMHELAARAFQANLKAPGGAQARAYLTRRGVTGEQIAEFGLGYAENSWDQLTRRLGDRFAPDQIEASGLVSKRQEGSGVYDRFRNRLIFPIHNEAGKVIGFGGRALSDQDQPKYLNSPETPIYRKSYVLYNLHRAKEAIRRSGQIVLVEGYMDALGVYSAGVHEVVASCGTALTTTQVRALKRHADKIVVNFDPDTAGSNATEKSIQTLLEENIRVRVLELDGGLDPDEFVKQAGAEVYRDKLERASGYFHWLADRARRKFDMRTAEGRMSGLKILLPSIQRIDDKLERAAIAEEVAGYLGIERGLVLDQFRKAAAERRSSAAPANIPSAPPLEKLLLGALLASEAARASVLPELRELPGIEQFATRRLLEALFAVAGAGAFRYSEFEARLNDSDRDLLAAIAFADEISEESTALEQAIQCLQVIKEQHRESARASMRERIKAAERRGDIGEALRLAGELNQLPLKRMRSDSH